jgi:hypothetical protein
MRKMRGGCLLLLLLCAACCVSAYCIGELAINTCTPFFKTPLAPYMLHYSCRVDTIVY